MKYISNNSYVISNSDFISLLPNIIDSKEELLKYVAKNGDLIRYLPEESRIDIDVIMYAIKNDCDSIVYIPNYIFSNEEICLSIINQCPLQIQYFNKINISTKKMLLEAIKHIGVDTLWDLNPKYYQDVEIIYFALISPYGQNIWESITCSAGEDFNESKLLIEKGIKIYDNKILTHDMSWIRKNVINNL